MIDSLRQIHAGKTIAVLGSGPSLSMFQGKEDVSIAVNGAADIKIPYDYFMCEDIRSPERPWFYSSKKCGATRIICAYLSPDDEVLYPDKDVRKQMFQERKYVWNQRGTMGYAYYLPTLPPKSPHRWFMPHPLTPDRMFFPPDYPTSLALVCGGSIACTAIQMAFVMGASRISLYGCSMDNESGDNYFIKSHGKIGEQPEGNLRNFRIILKFLSSMVRIDIYGKSKLLENL